MKKLFLRWALVTMVALAIIAATLLLGKDSLLALNAVGKAMAGVIVLIYLASTIYSGILCWRTDKAFDLMQHYGAAGRKMLAELRHKAEHVNFAQEICPYVGLLGAVTGIFVLMTTGLSGSTDPARIKEVIAASLLGIGIAFVPTITGIFFKIILSTQYYMLVHAIDAKEKGRET